MRARYLLLNNHYFRQMALDRVAYHPDKLKIISWYFDGKLFIPEVLKKQYQQEEVEKLKDDSK